jgi:uncharacterized protein YqhQ
LRGFSEWLNFARLLSEVFSVGESEEGEGGGVAVLGAILVALLLFVLVPQMIASLVVVHPEAAKFIFVKLGAQLVLLWCYLGSLRFLPSWRASFRMHSAFAQALRAFESGSDLQLDTVRQGAPRVSRDRLSAAVLLLVVVLVFSATAQILGFPSWLKALVVLPAIALTEEWLRWAMRRGGRLGAFFLLPYTFFESMMRMEPEDRDLEVAILAVRQAIRLEKGVPSPRRQSAGVSEDEAPGFEEFEIQRLVELGSVRADPKDFSE